MTISPELLRAANAVLHRLQERMPPKREIDAFSQACLDFRGVHSPESNAICVLIGRMRRDFKTEVWEGERPDFHTLKLREDARCDFYAAKLEDLLPQENVQKNVQESVSKNAHKPRNISDYTKQKISSVLAAYHLSGKDLTLGALSTREIATKAKVGIGTVSVYMRDRYPNGKETYDVICQDYPLLRGEVSRWENAQKPRRSKA